MSDGATDGELGRGMVADAMQRGVTRGQGRWARRLRGGLGSALVLATLSGPGAARAVADGVPPAFTQEQAERGQAAYRRYCQNCHGSRLDNGEFGGAPLNGQYFTRHWGGGSVAGLYDYIRARMPADRPGRLSPQTYADLTAFLLSRNGYPPAGAELTPDAEEQQRMSLRRE